MVKNIIHIEDDDDDIEIFKDVVALQPIPKSYLNFKSHNEALQRLLDSRDGADLIVINYLMVACNTENLIREIRLDSTLGRTPIIILSSAYNSKKVEMLLQLGANAYFQKPDSYRKYVEIIEHIMKLPKGIFVEDQS